MPAPPRPEPRKQGAAPKPSSTRLNGTLTSASRTTVPATTLSARSRPSKVLGSTSGGTASAGASNGASLIPSSPPHQQATGTAKGVAAVGDDSEKRKQLLGGSSSGKRAAQFNATQRSSGGGGAGRGSSARATSHGPTANGSVTGRASARPRSQRPQGSAARSTAGTITTTAGTTSGGGGGATMRETASAEPVPSYLRPGDNYAPIGALSREEQPFSGTMPTLKLSSNGAAVLLHAAAISTPAVMTTSVGNGTLTGKPFNNTVTSQHPCQLTSDGSLFVVGNAVVNPHSSVSPAVQQKLREVPPAGAHRGPVGRRRVGARVGTVDDLNELESLLPRPLPSANGAAPGAGAGGGGVGYVTSGVANVTAAGGNGVAGADQKRPASHSQSFMSFEPPTRVGGAETASSRNAPPAGAANRKPAAAAATTRGATVAADGDLVASRRTSPVTSHASTPPPPPPVSLRHKDAGEAGWGLPSLRPPLLTSLRSPSVDGEFLVPVTAVTADGAATVSGRDDGVPIPETLLTVQRVVRVGRSRTQSGAPKSVHTLHRLYKTGAEDAVSVDPAQDGTVVRVRDVLPELLHAESRSNELAAVRRHIDWDTHIPTADTLPPPSIVFLNANGQPVSHLHTITLLLDATTLQLRRVAVEESGDANGSGGSGPPTASNGAQGGKARRSAGPQRTTTTAAAATATAASACMNGTLNATALQAAQSVAQTIVFENGEHRVKGLVGLLKGLAEKVGLQRVLEYEVRTRSSDLFLAPPYVDAAVGDLVLHLNASLQGATTLTIVGFDCGCVDPNTGNVLESSNTLQCVVRVAYAGAGLTASSTATQPYPSSSSSPMLPSPLPPVLVGRGSGEARAAAASLRTSPFLETPSPEPESVENGGEIDPASSAAAMPLSLACFSWAGKDGSATGIASGAAAGGGGGGKARDDDNEFDSWEFTSSIDEDNRVEEEEQGIGPGNRMGDNRPDAAAGTPSLGPASRPHHRPYKFSATNPCELTEEDCSKAVHDYILHRWRVAALAEAKQRQKQEERQPPASAVAGVNSATSRASSARLRAATSSSPPGTTTSTRAGTWSDDDEGVADDDDADHAETLEAEFDQPLVETVAAESVTNNRRRGGEGGTAGGSAANRVAFSEGADAASGRAHPDGGARSSTMMGSATTGAAASPASELPATELSFLRHLDKTGMWLLSEGIRSPHAYMRLTAWQDRWMALFAENEDLFEDAQRSQVKRRCRQELGGLLNHISLGASSASLSITMGSKSRHASSHHRRGPPAMAAGPSPLPTSDHALTSLRRLILCLLLEEDRSSNQLFLDTVELCSMLVNGVLLRTAAVTGGTAEGLQRMAMTALSQATPSQGSSRPHHQQQQHSGTTRTDSSLNSGGEGSPRSRASTHPPSNMLLSDKELNNFFILADALEVATTATMLLGAYVDSVVYAQQRIHALCVLEGDTTAVVSAAQRDLAELCFFYGDYVTAVTVGEDVLMLTEQLFDPDSLEVVEAEIMLGISCMAKGDSRRGKDLIRRLVARVQPETRSAFSEMVQAQLELSLAFFRITLPPHDADALGLTVDNSLAALDMAVVQLRGSGDLREMERSYSTVWPPPRVTSAAASATAGGGADPVRTHSSGGEAQSQPTSVPTVSQIGSQKRLRWNLLTFAGALLIRYGEVDRGIKVMEEVLEGLVLSRHRFIEKRLRGQLAAQLWVQLALWRFWAYPSSAASDVSLVKRVVSQLTTTNGPFHPDAAVANLLLAQLLPDPAQAVRLGSKAYSVLQRSVAECSFVLRQSDRMCSLLRLRHRQWRTALEHANKALTIGRVSRGVDNFLCVGESEFLTCLLRCPPAAFVQLDTGLLFAQLRGRLARMEFDYGLHSDELLRPLTNLVAAHYLMQHYDEALGLLQRAVRVADPKGVLYVTAPLLKPADQLPTPEDVVARDQAVQGVLQTKSNAYQLAQVLFAMAAVLEAQGATADAKDCYGRCLALLESADLDGSLAAVRVTAAIAKLVYTHGELGDAYAWARRAHRKAYNMLPVTSIVTRDAEACRKLLAVVEYELCVAEGTYVTINPHAACEGVAELI